VPSELELAIAPTQVGAKPAAIPQASSEGIKTVAERAVDRVTHGVKLSKAVPAGF